MTDGRNRSWNELVESLRAVAEQIRHAVEHKGPRSPEEEAAASRLKADLSRLEQTAADLRTKLTTGVHEQRAEFEESIDRERVAQTTDQLKASLDELLSLARTVATELGAAAGATFEQVRPELTSAARSLEDVAGSAGAWLRAVLDTGGARPRDRGQGEGPPLDDL